MEDGPQSRALEALTLASNAGRARSADAMNKNLLIVGAGSIGERHTRTLREVGASVTLIDKRADRAREIADRYGCSSWHTSLKEAMLDEFDAAIIATPADTHIPIARACTDAGLHLLVEKPLATAFPGIAELLAECHQKNLTLAVAYVLRFHPVLERVRQICQKGTLGRLLSLRAVCHHYLPSSRPDYQQTYYVATTGGGGVVLDLSHELNYVEWLLGPLHLSYSRLATVPELGTPGEAIADLCLESEEGLPVQIHLHAADRQVGRECHIVGSRASLTANLLTGAISICSSPDNFEHLECRSNRDDWHRAQAKDFLEAITIGRPPRCTGEEGLRTLRLCLQAMAGRFPKAELPGPSKGVKR